MRLLIILSLFISSYAYAQKQKVIYKYKQYEKFDLGDMEIKGSIIAPGDLSIKERRRKIFKRELLRRDNFDKNTIQEIKFLR